MLTLCTNALFPASAVPLLEQMQCLAPFTLALLPGNLRRPCLLQLFGHEKPNSVNDKKGWSAHPSHLMPGAHKPQEIRPCCVVFATSGATKAQQQRYHFTGCAVMWKFGRMLECWLKSFVLQLKDRIVSKHPPWLSVLEQKTETCSVAYPDLWPLLDGKKKTETSPSSLNYQIIIPYRIL